MSDWDIFDLDEEEWHHFQILDRLHEEGVDCYFVDIFSDDVAWVVGYSARNASDGRYEIATALNIPEDIVYYDSEHSIAFINLYQLKAIRSGCSDIIDEYSKKHGLFREVD